jgi:hypothetical protein
MTTALPKPSGSDSPVELTSWIAPLLERNRRFAASDTRKRLASSFGPRRPLFVVTCIDPRVDPAAVLGVELGEAIVLRNAGGRVTPAVIHDVAFISFTRCAERAYWPTRGSAGRSRLERVMARKPLSIRLFRIRQRRFAPM